MSQPHPRRRGPLAISCPRVHPSVPTGPWFWRLQPSGQLVSPRPARLHRFWEGLPAQVQVIQAAYARPPDGRILLFSGECARAGLAALGRAGREERPLTEPPRRPAVLGVPGPAAGGRRAAAHRAGAAPGGGGGRRVLVAAEWEDLPDQGPALLALRRGGGAPGPRLPARPEPLGGGASGPRRCHRQQHRWESPRRLGVLGLGRRGPGARGDRGHPGAFGEPRAERGTPREGVGWGSRRPDQPLSVCSLLAGDTYFFKGAHYWRFPKGSVQAEPDSPQPMGPKWLDCPAPRAGPRTPRPPKATLKPGPCDCQCELNQAAGRGSVPLLLPLLSLLVGVVASR